jgi:hypothetical protein
MANVQKCLELLGMRVRDKVTNFEGIVVSVSFDLYGCIQAIIHPGLDKDGKMADQLWFDVNRLIIISDYSVMKCPDFNIISTEEGENGPVDKPKFIKT